MKIVVLDGYALNPGDLSWEGLEGKTMGIIGYASIGRAAGSIAQAFGMKVLFNMVLSRNNLLFLLLK